MAKIKIGSFSSICGNCNRGATPQEDGHYTIAEYSPLAGEPGCGELWDDAEFSTWYYPEPQQMIESSLALNENIILLLKKHYGLE